MEGAGPWGWPCLLLLLRVSGFQAVDEEEKQIYLQEGRNLTVSCVYNIMLFSSSLKAWQRVESQGPPETLVHTSTRNLSLNQAWAGRYLLEDRPSDAIMMVTITELQPQDLGLYQCVIYLLPQNFHLLLPRIRLTQYKGGTASSHHLLLESLVIHVGRPSEDGRAPCICLELLKKPPFAPASWGGVHHVGLRLSASC
nr:triggering receptor expressed on myeloid cells 1 isoform X1 [Manis javanica]